MKPSRLRRFGAAGLVVGIGVFVLVVGILAAAKPSPSDEQVADVEQAVRTALVDVFNWGVPPRVSDAEPSRAIIGSMSSEVRARFAARLKGETLSWWEGLAMAYFDRLANGESRTWSTGATFSDWRFERPAFAGDRATVDLVVNMCSPYIDYERNPPERGNPCGDSVFHVELVRVGGTWAIDVFTYEPVVAP